jgi:hypothetical protein
MFNPFENVQFLNYNPMCERLQTIFPPDRSFRTATVQRHSILQLPFRSSLLYNILLKVYLTGGGFDEEIHGGEQKIPGASCRNDYNTVILCNADDTC